MSAKFRSSQRLSSFIHSFIYIRRDYSDAIKVKTASGALYNNVRKT